MKKPQPVKLDDARDERALILDALEAWIKQRPGMDPHNYDRAGWNSDARRVQQQRRDALELLRSVRWSDDVTADRLKNAFERAFSGRLRFSWRVLCLVFKGEGEERTKYVPMRQEFPTLAAAREYAAGVAADRKAMVAPHFDYVTGQYWCTEYRAAAAAVLAYALWDAWRADLPDGLDAPGKVLREMARRRFGAGIQKRWFN